VRELPLEDPIRQAPLALEERQDLCQPSEYETLEVMLGRVVGDYHSASEQSLYDDETTVYHLHPHLVASEQIHATEWLRIGRIRFYGTDLSIP
jgi:hypothetical protein